MDQKKIGKFIAERRKAVKLTQIIIQTLCTSQLPTMQARVLTDFGVGEQHFLAPRGERLA